MPKVKKRASKPTAQSRRGQYKQASRQRANRQRLQSARSHLKLIFGVSGGALACIVVGWIWLSGTGDKWASMAHRAVHQQLAAQGLAVKQVYLSGHERVSKHAVLHQTGLNFGASILAMSPQKMRESLEALPQIRRAKVMRHLPDTVEIHLEERRPVALWKHAGKYQLIDRDGVALQPADPQRHGELPLVIGEGAAAQITALQALLSATPELARQFASAIWVNQRRWDMRLRSGVVVKLPEHQPQKALQSLEALYAQTPLEGDKIVSVDLRVPERMFLRPQVQLRQGEASPQSGVPSPYLKQAVHHPL